ncbi:MAG: GNAT family N-acetyltransferase [Paludibacteraceae bacterium]|nr:GNAT family N-acetyltransferase [Paludibacteraceae bacterium]
MKIRELETYTQSQFEDLKRLMTELSDRVIFSEQKLADVLSDRNCHLYVVQENDLIIGCATLCVFHSPTGAKASIEDVVVLSDYRGQHLGKQLMEHVLAEAQKLAPIELHLTSNPKRIVTNLLYQSLGFERKETNCYIMNS